MAENAFKADWPSFALGFNTGKSKGRGGVELNIAYGDTPPEDTSKLWVKTSEPSKVIISTELEKEIISDGTLVCIDTLDYNNHTKGATGVVGGKIYLLGGTCKSVISCFDPETNTFTTLEQTLPTEGLLQMAYATVGNRIYMFGGQSSGTGTSHYRNKIYYFDAETKEVVKLSEVLPESAPNYPSACTIGTNIILTQVYKSTPNNKLYCFDTLTEKLSELPFTLPYAVESGSLVSDGKYLYFVGGKTDSKSFYSVLRIDIEAQTVTDLHIDLATLLYNNQAALLGSKLFVWGRIYANPSVYAFGMVAADIYMKSTQKYRNLDTIGTDLAFDASRGVAFGDSLYLFNGHKDYSSTKIMDVYKFRPGDEKILVPKNAMNINTAAGIDEVLLADSDSLKVEAGVSCVLKGNENGEGEVVEAAIYKDEKWMNI